MNRTDLSRRRFLAGTGLCPISQFLNDKAKRILGSAPRDDVSRLWRRPG